MLSEVRDDGKNFLSAVGMEFNKHFFFAGDFLAADMSRTQKRRFLSANFVNGKERAIGKEKAFFAKSPSHLD